MEDLPIRQGNNLIKKNEGDKLWLKLSPVVQRMDLHRIA